MPADPLAVYLDGLEDAVAASAIGWAEDQLKPPVRQLLNDVAAQLGIPARVAAEVPVAGVGRPDFAIAVDGLPIGFVELKHPDKGVNPARYTGHDRRQWEQFARLPNIAYSDGDRWALYRTGERVGRPVSATTDPQGVWRLIRELLQWEPQPPASYEALADTLAPLCRYLRGDVEAALADPDGALASLATTWRGALFPDATDAEFSDAYAQTVTYALLLATLDPSTDTSSYHGLTSIELAVRALGDDHGLMGEALKILTDRGALDEVGVGIDTIARVLSVVEPDRLGDNNTEPWLHFYEHFLGAYDARLREETGSYYTPLPVVRCQVRLVERLLVDQLGRYDGFADNKVVVLDPAAGTGTYPLAVIAAGVKRTRQRRGEGAVPGRATRLAENVHAFELQVGPYAVSHLRITRAILDVGGALPPQGPRVFLTDTLESADAVPSGVLPLFLRALGRERERARLVKRQTPVLVCVGNPPYDRQALGVHTAEHDAIQISRRREELLGEFLALARGRTMFSHIASLYNLYVYFWRWALEKVFASGGPGVVSFITASSYLDGPGFIGMREVMRRTFDELWLLDLGGSSLGARRESNVFAIQTPVCIAIGVRRGSPNPGESCVVHYARISGETRQQKLDALNAVQTFADLPWSEAADGWAASFIPASTGEFASWPRLTDLFPWQHPGCKVGRTWPIATTRAVAEKRWQTFAEADPQAKARLFPDRRYGRRTTTLVAAESIPEYAARTPLATTGPNDPEPRSERYAFRTLDRQWVLADARLMRTPSPPMWFTHSGRQVFLTSLLTDQLGDGPAASAAAHVPDLHHFCNRGGKDVIPLWRDAAATQPNIARGLLELLSESLGPVTPEDLFAYAYAVLSAPGYTHRFRSELATPPPRIPLSRDPSVFTRAVQQGRRLLWLHTYGERFSNASNGQPLGEVPAGRARLMAAITSGPYPESYDLPGGEDTLIVGEGAISPVPRAVWDYHVSGFYPLRAWLGYRMRAPSGRRSSDLDGILPTVWPAEFDDELLDLIWVLEHTVNMHPALDLLLHDVVDGPLFSSDDLVQPTSDEREAPPSPGAERAAEPRLL